MPTAIEVASARFRREKLSAIVVAAQAHGELAQWQGHLASASTEGLVFAAENAAGMVGEMAAKLWRAREVVQDLYAQEKAARARENGAQ